MDPSYKDSLELNQMKNSSVKTHVANLLRVLVLVTHNHSRTLILETAVPAATPNITQLLPMKKGYFNQPFRGLREIHRRRARRDPEKLKFPTSTFIKHE